MGQRQLGIKQKGLQMGKMGGEEKWKMGFPLTLESSYFFSHVDLKLPLPSSGDCGNLSTDIYFLLSFH